MPRTIATGNDIWTELKKYPSLSAGRYTKDGKVFYVKPFTKADTMLFVTSNGTNSAGESLYIHDDALKREGTGKLLRGAFAGEVSRQVYKKTSHIIPAYRCLVYFAVYATGFGLAFKGVKAFSFMVFAANNAPDLAKCEYHLRNIISLMRKVYKPYPLLAGAMLCVAIEETSGTLKKEIKTKGAVRFVVSNLDLTSYAEELAKLAGLLLCSATGGLKKSGNSKVVGFLKDMGLKRLAKIVPALRKIRNIYLQSKKVTGRPGVDKAEIATKLIESMKEAGVKMSQKEAIKIVDEGGMADKAAMDNLQRLSINIFRFSNLLLKLSKAADDEIL